MAAPHVAGVAAVLLSQTPSMLPVDVTSKILALATSGIVSNAGAGSPNRLLFAGPSSTTATAPAAPSSVVATAGVRSASLKWVRGADGGSVVTGQTITIYRGSTRIGTVAVSGSATSATVTGLRQGTSYSFTVSATNSVGTSSESVRSNVVVALR
jgi:subtilisin family serine protease